MVEFSVLALLAETNPAALDVHWAFLGASENKLTHMISNTHSRIWSFTLLSCLSTVIAGSAIYAQDAHSLASAPSGLADAIRTDLPQLAGVIESKCIGTERGEFERSFAFKVLALQNKAPNLIAATQITYPCIPSTSNHPILIYANLRNGWSRVLTADGAEAKALPRKSYGLPNILIQGHASSFQIIESTFRFTGTEYKMVNSRYVAVGGGHPKPM